MPLDDVFDAVRPNLRNGGTNPLELAIEEFLGLVEGTLQRRSLTKGWIPMKAVRGTTTIRTDAIGKSTLQKAVPGATPDGTQTEFGKNTLTVDTLILARAVLPLLDTFQTSYDKRAEIAMEHGKEIGKFLDQAMFIQAIKASLLTASRYSNAGNELDGHSGGSTEVLGAAGDANDPARLVAAIANLMVKLHNKDVNPIDDGLVIVARPATYFALLQAEQLINTDYLTAEGNSVNGMVLKSYGVPIWNSNNYPAGSVITGNLLSNAGNGNAYDGDFTKVVMTAFSPRALLAGETIPLQPDVFYDKVSKHWFVDAHLSFGATPSRAEMAGSILIP